MGRLNSCTNKVFQKMFFKIGVLKKFAKFARKDMCQQPATLLKKTPAQVFSYGFCEIFKNTCLTGYIILGRLLLFAD